MTLWATKSITLAQRASFANSGIHHNGISGVFRMPRWTSLISRSLLCHLLSCVRAHPHTSTHIHTQTRTSTNTTLPIIAKIRTKPKKKKQVNVSHLMAGDRYVCQLQRISQHPQRLNFFFNEETNAIPWNSCTFLIGLFVLQVKRDLHVCKETQM